jgi:hypothetical protein
LPWSDVFHCQVRVDNRQDAPEELDKSGDELSNFKFHFPSKTYIFVLDVVKYGNLYSSHFALFLSYAKICVSVANLNA